MEQPVAAPGSMELPLACAPGVSAVIGDYRVWLVQEVSRRGRGFSASFPPEPWGSSPPAAGAVTTRPGEGG